MFFKKTIKAILKFVLPKGIIKLLKGLKNLEEKLYRLDHITRFMYKDSARRRWEALRGNGKKKILVVGYLSFATHQSMYIHLRDFFNSPLFDTVAIDDTTFDSVKETIIVESLPAISSYENRLYGSIPSIGTDLVWDAFLLFNRVSYPENIVENIVGGLKVRYIHLEDILNFYKPDLVLTKGFHTPDARLLRVLCKKCRIHICSHEYGVLPGTTSFDFMGQMATSWVTKHSDYFNALPIDAQEIDNAKKYIAMGADPKYSRNTLSPMSQSMKRKLGAVRSSGKKIILYIGSAIYSSYEETVFKNDFEAYPYLAEIGEKHTDWHILYKPHPLSYGEALPLGIGQRCTVIKEGTLLEALDFADCAITILSQGAYVSILKGVPIILLGYLQLNSSGAAYLPEREELESVIEKALSDGFTEEQREKFIEHTARILKYYVYTAYPDISTDRDINRFSEDLLSVINGNEPEHLKYEREAYLKQME